jgi:hypothetical protein
MSASHATALDRNEVGAVLVAAGLGTAAEHALVSPLALNGLRVSEATGAGSKPSGPNAGTALRRTLRRNNLHHPGQPAAGPARHLRHRRLHRRSGR